MVKIYFNLTFNYYIDDICVIILQSLNMKDQILNYIDQPEQLEQLYRKDKQQFTKSFNELSVEQRAK